MHIISGIIQGVRDLTASGIGGEHLEEESRDIVVPLSNCMLFLGDHDDGHEIHNHKGVNHARYFPGYYVPSLEEEAARKAKEEAAANPEATPEPTPEVGVETFPVRSSIIILRPKLGWLEPDGTVRPIHNFSF